MLISGIKNKRFTLLLTTIASLAILPSGASAANTNSSISPREAHDIGVEAYCYFYPLVTMDVTMKQTTNAPAGERPGFGPANTFSHMRAYPDANFRAVVRPNFDTLYSSAWLDLRKEPVIISVPDTKGRYYLLPLLDMWTDVVASPGWRTSGTGAQLLAIVPPGWNGVLPAGVEKIELTTPTGWMIGRIKTDGPDDYPAVHAIQDALKITPLSQWGKETKPVESKIDPSIDMKTGPLETVNAMSAGQFFSKSADLLKEYPPHKTDWSLLARLRRVGFVPGEKFDITKIDPALATEFAKGASDGLALMKQKTNSLGTPVNGWSMNVTTMGVYGNYYLKRGIVAMVGLGANQEEDAIYPLNYADASGKPPVGEKNYVLHFGKDQMPPAQAFWSVTMYDADGYQVANELNRFAVSSWMPLKKNADGSLDIYIQHANPGADKVSNWLPSPASGNLGITMRLYAPDPAVLNGDWAPPAISEAK